MEFSGLKYLLFDVEGTTSDIRFVRDVMFPYSAKVLPEFLKTNASDPVVSQILEETSLAELQDCIEKDIKHPHLKKLQGMIWKKAFEAEEFTAPVYEDVVPAWKAWLEKGFLLGIYSSGSVTAQKMFFSHTREGNLLPMLHEHFDLEVGSKKDSASYSLIADKLGLKGKEILFLSDVPEELAAAQNAGFQVIHIVREGTPQSDFQSVSSFADLELQP